jgi:hypothetical protein
VATKEQPSAKRGAGDKAKKAQRKAREHAERAEAAARRAEAAAREARQALQAQQDQPAAPRWRRGGQRTAKPSGEAAGRLSRLRRRVRDRRIPKHGASKAG